MRVRFKALTLLLAGVVFGMLLAPQTVQAAVNYFNETKTAYGTGYASCGYGWKVTGGGAYELPDDHFSTQFTNEYELTGSWPSSVGTWKATATSVQGTYSTNSGWSYTTYNYRPRVYAICAR